MSKRKGTNAERDLIKLFWSFGWGAVRVAGSGSMHFPSPDILAGNKVRRLAIEVKTTKSSRKYFTHNEIKQLYNFSDYFGAEPWLAIKFSRTEWVFVNPEDLDETGKNYVFARSKCQSKGLSVKELLGELA
jgi:Holliday junction resolvase